MNITIHVMMLCDDTCRCKLTFNLCPMNIRSISSSHHIKPVWLMMMMNAGMRFPFLRLPLAPANLHI